MLLPSLVFLAEVESAGVLEVWGQDDGLVAGLAGKLDTEVPSVEGDKDEVEILRREVFRGKGIETVDSVTEAAGIANMLPSQGGQAR